MVDNFDLIRNLLHFENKDDCYYVQLLRRQSDDPHVNGVADPRYHGNMHSRSIKDYLVPSLAYFDKIKEDIITLCNTFNVRAYIRLNKRTYKDIALEMLKHIADQVRSGETFNSPYHLVASAAGKTCSAGDDKTWILDLDEEYVPYQEDIFKMMFECEPYVREIEKEVNNTIELTKGMSTSDDLKGKTPEDIRSDVLLLFRDITPVIPTKHGRHIIARPFNKQTMSEKWNEYCKENGLTMPLPRHFTDPENKYTTFELTDLYLNKAQEFEYFLPKHKTIKNDKNKISFVMDKLSDWDLHMLDFCWKGQCLKNGYWMKMFDCHKDNPTILYVP